MKYIYQVEEVDLWAMWLVAPLLKPLELVKIANRQIIEWNQWDTWLLRSETPFDLQFCSKLLLSNALCLNVIYLTLSVRKWKVMYASYLCTLLLKGYPSIDPFHWINDFFFRKNALAAILSIAASANACGAERRFRDVTPLTDAKPNLSIGRRHHLAFCVQPQPAESAVAALTRPLATNRL